MADAELLLQNAATKYQYLPEGLDDDDVLFDLQGEVKEKILCRCCPSGLWNVVLMGLSLMLAFSAFNPMQGIQTTIHPGNTAFTSLGILYGFLCLTNLVSAGVTLALGEKWTMITGGAAFVTYMACQIGLLFISYNTSRSLYEGILYASSAILGIGGSFLFTAQGSLMTKSAPLGKLGLYNGVFFALYMCNYVIGGLILNFVPTGPKFTIPTSTLPTSLPVSSALPDNFLLFTVLGGVGFLGAIFAFMLYQPLKQIREAKQGVTFDVWGTLRLFKDRRMLLLVPLMLYSGLSAAFFYGTFSAQAGDRYGLCLVIFGATEVAFALLSGRVSDRLGRLPVLVLGFVVAVSGFIAAFFADEERDFLYYICYGLFGIGDTTFNVMAYVILGTYLPTQTQGAFAFYKLIQSFGTAVAFLYSIHIVTAEQPVLYSIIILGAVLLISMVLVVVLHYKVESIDGYARKMKYNSIQSVEEFE